jgi:hypothetical protein
MHKPTEAQAAPEGTGGTVSEEPIAQVPGAAVTPEPDPISPMGFSAMAGVIGLAGGMVLAPWLERWYRRVVKSNREEENE